MNASSMRVAATCALLATTCLSTFVLTSPALAQNADIPSAYKNIDENGVDLTDGSFNFSLVEGSIGSGEGLLSLVRYDAGGSSLDNWEGLALHIEGGTATVSLGDRSETFTAGSAGFSADQANGATLVGSGSHYEYRNASGTEIVFASPTGSPTPDQTGFCSTAPDAPCDLAARSIVEPNGKRITLTWELEEPCDAAGACTRGWRLLEVSNNLGYAMRVAYQPGGIVDGQITQAWFDRASVTFQNRVSTGSTPTVTYSTPAAGVTEITDAGGRMWRITTDAEGRITAIKRPGAASDSTRVVYGASGVAQVTHEGVTTNYARTVIGLVATTVVSDALGTRRTVMSNLASGRPTQVTDGMGRTTLYAYDASDRLTEVTAPEGNKRLTTYDMRGNATRVIARAKPGADGSPSLADIVTEAGYDLTCDNAAVCNQPRWTTDAAGAQTDYGYDALGNVTSVKSPPPTPGAVRPETRYVYETLAAPFPGSDITMLAAVAACRTDASCAGTANEVRATLRYALPNLQLGAVETGAGDGSLKAQTLLGYDEIGNLTSVDGPLPGTADTVRSHYNASREIVGTIGADPDGTGPLRHRAQLFVRSADGDVVVTYTGTAAGQTRADLDAMSALEAVHTGYDNRRLVYRSRDEGSVVTEVAQIAYDARGRVRCVTERMDPGKYTSALPNACELQLPAGAFGHDRRTITQYDAADRPVERIAASGLPEEAREAAAVYTANGQVALLVDANGNKTDYAYDGHDRLSRTSFPVQTVGGDTSNPQDYEELTYDARSLVTQKRLRDGKLINLAYDALGRAVSKDVPNLAFFENDVTYAYDNLGRLTGATDSAGIAITIGYDALGRKVSEGSNWYGTATSQYDLAGRRTRLTWRDGFAVDYRYLVTGETADIKEANGTLLAAFAYDDRGRRTSLTRGNGATTGYAYDLGARLRSLNHDLAGASHDLSLTFGYNPASQIVETGRSNDLYAFSGTVAGTTSFPVNGLNQLTAVGAGAVTHDARGNLARREMKTGSFDTYGYTAENRLSTKGYETIAGDTRTAGTNSEVAYDPLGRLLYLSSSATDFRYDGGEVIEETVAGTGALRKRFVHGPGVDEPLVVYDASGAKRWFHADERGSIVATSDASGNAATVHRYDEYGIPQDALGDRFGYTGQMWLPEAGVYSYKARMYDPRLGRFLQSDPIGYGDGMNLYAYVKGDPVNFIDPTGEACATFRQRGSGPAGNDGNGGPVITAGRRVTVCWDDNGFEDGGARGGVGGGGGFVSPCLGGRDCTVSLPPPPPAPPVVQRCPVPPAARSYPIPKGFKSAGVRNNLYVRTTQGELVNNPLYDQARAKAGGVDLMGVGRDLAMITGGVAWTLWRGAIGMAVPFSESDALRAGALVGSSAVKTGNALAKANCSQ